MESIFASIEAELTGILNEQRKSELLEVIEQFKTEKRLIREKVEGTLDPSEEFAMEVKELENAINEHVAVKFTLQIPNPLVRENMTVGTYEDLLVKYAGYLTTDWETQLQEKKMITTSVARGLAAIHAITMLAQVADDITTPWWDFNRRILNPATQQLMAGKTEEEMRQKLKEKVMGHYVCILKKLNVNPVIIWYLYKNGEFFFKRFLDQYKSGKSHPHDPFYNLRVELARKGLFDKPVAEKSAF